MPVGAKRREGGSRKQQRQEAVSSRVDAYLQEYVFCGFFRLFLIENVTLPSGVEFTAPTAYSFKPVPLLSITNRPLNLKPILIFLLLFFFLLLLGEHFRSDVEVVRIFNVQVRFAESIDVGERLGNVTQEKRKIIGPRLINL